jgi:shikimate kinase
VQSSTTNTDASGASRPLPAAGHVVVVGLMGSGKTSVGRAVAAASGRRFLDSDELLAERYGTTAAALAAERGLGVLHRMETDLLVDALSSPDPAVIAAAASVVDDPRGREALGRDGVHVVWLDAPVAVLAERAAGSDHRPLGEDPVAVLAEQDARRRPWFHALADRTVDVAARSSDDAARDVVAWLASGGP